MPKCLECNEKQASYGIEGGKPTHCVKCSEDDMIDVVNKKCLECKEKRASYGIKGGKPTHCSKCSEDDMVDVVHKKCVKCKVKQPKYGLQEGKPTHCVKCSEDNMIDVVNKKCVKCNEKQPSYGFEGGEATHCSKCSEDDMINVVRKKCVKCNVIQPNYGFEGDKATHCVKCSEDDMVDVVSKKCVKCNEKQPSYGFEGGEATHCVKCSEDDMIDVVHEKCVKCNVKRATYGFEGDKATHCLECSEDDMVNVVNKRCLSDWCNVRPSNPRYEGYCYHCFANLFPDKPISREYKRKENEVAKYLKNKFSTDFVFDKIVGACSKRRPDVFLDLFSHVIICEIDENQHSGYDTICENKRIMELSKDLDHRPIVFLRFNPDRYTDRDTNKNIPSPWNKTKTGVTLLKDRKLEWNNRLDYLSKRLEYWMNIIPEKTITIEHLFFTEKC
jgi:hypothetical protein